MGVGAGDGSGVKGDGAFASGPGDVDTSGRAGGDEESVLTMEISDDFRFTPSISYRLRFYHTEGRDFVEGAVTNAFRHQARLGAAVQYRDLARVFIQMQDVRTFGEEADPAGDFSANGLDVHQGYMDLHPRKDMRFRLGRQEVALANERLVGRPLFLEQSRSFDGLHFRLDQQVELELGYFLVRDYAVGQVEPGLASGKRHLGIGHLGYDVHPLIHPRIVVVIDGDTGTEKTVVTAGGIITGSVGDELTLDYSGEGYFQGGAEGDVNVSSWLAAFSTRVTTDLFGKPFAEVHAVLVSVDDAPDDPTAHSFASPFPRGHRIHGEMDFFINFPRDTDARGLRDFGGTLGWSPKDVRLTAAFHFFDAMATRPDGLRHFGFETNLKASYPFWKHASIDALYGFFVPGEIKRVGLADPRVEHFAYTTAQVGF